MEKEGRGGGRRGRGRGEKRREAGEGDDVNERKGGLGVDGLSDGRREKTKKLNTLEINLGGGGNQGEEAEASRSLKPEAAEHTKRK